jgi:FKBP-type peptidyl-prolyl cis-trans isomerase
MTRLTLTLLTLAIAAPAAAAQDKAAAPGKPTPGAPAAAPAGDPDQQLYSLGLAISESLKNFTLTPAELEKVLAGVRDGATGKPKFPFDQKAQASVNDLARTRFAAVAEKEKTKGAAAVQKAAAEKGAIKTASGAVVIPMVEGKGASPGPTDTVKVHYTGTLLDGKVFDSSRERGQPTEFPLNGVIKCWGEAVQKMKVGGRAKIVCPSDIAYGERGSPPVIPGNATLTFDVELLEVMKAPAGGEKK